MIDPNYKETLPPIQVSTPETSPVSTASVCGKNVKVAIESSASSAPSKDSNQPGKKRSAPGLEARELPPCKKIPPSISQPELQVCPGKPFEADSVKKALSHALKIKPASENKKLGKGAFGRVEKWVAPDTQARFAIKIMRRSLSERMQQQVMTKNKGEINALRCSHHPHCINTWAIILSQPDSNRFCLINDLSQYPRDVSPGFLVKAVISDYVDGDDLRKALNPKTALPGASHSPEFAIEIGSAVAEALASLHNDGLIYRDLKAENIMLDRVTLQPKLIDFGYTKNILEKKTTSSFCGTIHYSAPEILNSRVPYDFKVDAWSLGMLLIDIAVNLDLLDLDFPDISDIEETSIPLRAETLGKMTDQKRRQFLIDNGMKLPAQFDPLLDVIVWLTRHNPKTRLSVRTAAGLLASMKPRA